jgi:hypothetical protein
LLVLKKVVSLNMKSPEIQDCIGNIPTDSIVDVIQNIETYLSQLDDNIKSALEDGHTIDPRETIFIIRHFRQLKAKIDKVEEDILRLATVYK